MQPELHGIWPVYSVNYKVYNESYTCAGELSKSEELAKVNPLKTVPSMDDSGFYLFER